MTLEIINQSDINIPRAFLSDWIAYVCGVLVKKKIIKKNQIKEFNIIFVRASVSQQLNMQYRSKNKATDVLSFSGADSFLGELVICSEVCKRQSKENNHSFRDEAAYLVLHGLLHLLGFEHEGCSVKAKKMFSLQDKIFEEISSFNK